MTNIDHDAFKGCSDLTSVTLNSNAIVSKNYTESYHLSSVFGWQVTEYIISNNVTSIGDYAFDRCSNLTSFTIPNSVTSIGRNAFSGCSGLTSITIPNSVTSIGNSAFSHCSGLTSITIPNSVTSIGSLAFYNCSGLTSVTIPNSVTSIGGYAFSDCSSLISVTVLNPTPATIDYYTFTNRTNATLYVPIGSKEAYQAAYYWKEFKEIVEIDPAGIEQIMGSENGKPMIFTIDGKRVNNLKKGMNVIRMKDGTTRKVVVK